VNADRRPPGSNGLVVDRGIECEAMEATADAFAACATAADCGDTALIVDIGWVRASTDRAVGGASVGLEATPS